MPYGKTLPFRESVFLELDHINRYLCCQSLSCLQLSCSYSLVTMGAACFKQYPEEHLRAEKILREGKRQRQNELKLLLLGKYLFNNRMQRLVCL